MLNLIKEKILLKPSDFKPSSNKFEILGVLNPGAARLKDRRIILYARIIEKFKKIEDEKHFYSPRFTGKNKFEIKIDRFKKESVVSHTDVDFSFKDGTKRLTYISHLRRVFLDKTGFKILKIDQKPFFYGLKDDSELGVEDPRITKIENKYYMTYVGLSRKGNISTYLAESKDCSNWKRLGIIFGEQDKDVVLFPEKIKDRFVAFDRPEGNFEFSTPHFWIAYSKDLISWGKLKPISLSKKNIFSRSGAGPPPIKTEKGWLLIFHGVTPLKPSGIISSIRKFFGMRIITHDSYAVWAGLFDLKNPSKIIARSLHPVIYPKIKSFEDKMVLFPTGIIEDKENILLYSGAGDIYVTVKRLKIQNILKSLERV